MFAVRGIFRSLMEYIFTHSTYYACKTITLPSMSMYANDSFIHSFGIIQIFCAQSNKNNKNNSNDGNSTNKLQFSSFTHTVKMDIWFTLL